MTGFAGPVVLLQVSGTLADTQGSWSVRFPRNPRNVRWPKAGAIRFGTK
jgi:hypothetical protein